MGQRPDRVSLNGGHPLAVGLQALYIAELPGTTHFHDSSLYHNHGTLTNFAWPNTATSGWVDTTIGRKGLVCDGSDDYVATPDAINTVLSIAPFSMGCWFNTSSLATPYIILGVKNAWNCRCLWITSTIIAALDEMTDYPVINNAWSAVTGIWYHLLWTCPTFTSGINTLWINGSINKVGAAYTFRAGPQTTWSIGGKDQVFLGRITDPVIYNRILSPAEINILANPSDPMLGGLLLPLWPRVFAAAVAGGGITVPVLRHHYEQQGVC